MAVLVATRSSGFVVRRLFGGFEVTSVWGVSVSGGVVVSRALLLRRQMVLDSAMVRVSLVSGWAKDVVYGSWMVTLSASSFGNSTTRLSSVFSAVLFFGSQRLQLWGDSRLQSLIASVARLVMLTSQLYRGSFVLVRRDIAFGCGMRWYQLFGAAFSGRPKLPSVVSWYIKDTLSFGNALLMVQLLSLLSPVS
ncbi:hypothetical protein Bca101_054523 [Brassica carinata]